jgi:hypothetical protein
LTHDVASNEAISIDEWNGDINVNLNDAFAAISSTVT